MIEADYKVKLIEPMSGTERLRKVRLSYQRTQRHRCPFDFLTDFDRWFEFKKRTIADRELSVDVLDSMGVSLDRIELLAIIPIRVRDSDAPVLLEPRGRLYQKRSLVRR